MNQLSYHLITSLEKVFPSKEPTGEGMEETLTALKGETLSFQLAYRWNCGYKATGTLIVSSPVSDSLRFRTVELVPCEYPCHPNHDDDYLITEPGLYPDRLADIKDAEIPLIPNQWRSIWIDLETASLPAGSFKISLTVANGSDSLCCAAVTCELLDASLPQLPIPHTEWFHSDCLADYYQVEVFSEDYWRIVENFIRAAVRRSCNMLLTPVFTPPLDTAVGGERRTVQLVGVKVTNGVYHFDFTQFERWVSLCKACGIRYIEISHLFSQWGAYAAPKIMGERDGVFCRLFGWETDASGKEYQTFLTQFLTALKVELKQLGIEKDTWFHISDEPSMEQFESYKAAKECVAELLKGYHTFDALSDYAFYEKGLVSQPVCAIDHLEPFLKNRPEKLWTYYCTAQGQSVTNRFITMPAPRTRILGAQLYRYRLNGFLHWGYNFYNAQFSRFPIDPYRCTDADRAFPSGDAFLVYPGKDGMPEESIRMMLIDEAMSDYCAMLCLERLTDRETVLSCLTGENGETLTLTDYPRHIAELLSLRKRINDAIRLALSKTNDRKGEPSWKTRTDY